MKKLYTITLGLFLGANLSAQSELGEIVNGGFENWSSNVLYEAPTVWQSSNTQEYRGQAIITKSTDATHGSYSAKLETLLLDGDTLQPYVFHGGVGDNGPEGGIPFNSTFNQIVIDYKTDLLGTDTLNLLMIKTLNGTPVAMEIVEIATGTNTNWVTDTLDVSTVVQDSMFFGIILGGVDDEPVTPGSWALIDNIKLMNNNVAVADIPNPSFETWAETSVEEPDSWFTLNTMLSGVGMENAIKTLDSYEGTYAIEMTTIQPSNFGGDTISSYVSMGVIDFENQGPSPFLPVSYGATPGTISGAYKYSPVNGDQGGLVMQFMENGAVIGQHGEVFNSQSTYTTFSSSLNIVGTPDSLVFLISSGENPGSVLKIDGLNFSDGDVGVNELSIDEIDLYPNPATDVVNINGTSSSYDFFVYDITGKLVIGQANVKGTRSLDITNYNRGTYLVKIVSGNNVVTKKLSVQ